MRVYALGDFGDCSTVKRNGHVYCPRDLVRNAVQQHAAEPQAKGESVLALGLGDNFYPSGIRGDHAARFGEFKETFEQLEMPFFMMLGNHDHEGDTNAQVNFTRSKINPEVPGWNGVRLWSMPDSTYTFEVDNTLFVILDTEASDLARQIQLHKRTIRDSKAKWVIVAAHHPLKSDYRQWYDGKNGKLLEEFVRSVAHVYISGHDHCVQVLPLGEKTGDDFENGPVQVVSGASGSPPWFWVPRYHSEKSLVRTAPRKLGFAELDIRDTEIIISVVQVEPEASGEATVLQRVIVRPCRTFFLADFPPKGYVPNSKPQVGSRLARGPYFAGNIASATQESHKFPDLDATIQQPVEMV